MGVWGEERHDIWRAGHLRLCIQLQELRKEAFLDRGPVKSPENGVICSNLLVMAMNLAGTLWADWSLSKSQS